MNLRNWMKLDTDASPLREMTPYNEEQINYSLLCNYVEQVLNGLWYGDTELAPNIYQNQWAGDVFKIYDNFDADFKLQFGDIIEVRNGNHYWYAIYTYFGRGVLSDDSLNPSTDPNGQPTPASPGAPENIVVDTTYRPMWLAQLAFRASAQKSRYLADRLATDNLRRDGLDHSNEPRLDDFRARALDEKERFNAIVKVYRPLNTTNIQVGDREDDSLNDNSSTNYPTVHLVLRSILQSKQYRGDFTKFSTAHPGITQTGVDAIPTTTPNDIWIRRAANGNSMDDGMVQVGDIVVVSDLKTMQTSYTIPAYQLPDIINPSNGTVTPGATMPQQTYTVTHTLQMPRFYLATDITGADGKSQVNKTDTSGTITWTPDAWLDDPEELMKLWRAVDILNQKVINLQDQVNNLIANNNNLSWLVARLWDIIINGAPIDPSDPDLGIAYQHGGMRYEYSPARGDDGRVDVSGQSGNAGDTSITKRWIGAMLVRYNGDNRVQANRTP